MKRSAETSAIGAQNDGSAANLISQPSPFVSARTSCMLLGEELWSPETADFKSALGNSLNYQQYQGWARQDQVYWISKANPDDSLCRAIDFKGNTHPIQCGMELPTLCTQGAPVSSSSSSNNSAAWQAQQFVGNKLLTGYRDYHVWKFRGIRYADKPERFTYSKVASFEDSGEVDATTAGADCSQPVGEVKNGSSEDCLFANVWTPYLPRSGGLDPKSKLRPVMLYLYGGGFTSGSGKNPNTDGTNLASRGDVVAVSVNYRVGSLGFLNFNDGVHNGNYALSDIVTALEWVNKYIKYFGGDPDNVTLFGESAGAEDTHIVLGVAKAKGLFHRAAMQSSADGWPGNGKLLAWPYYDSLENNYETTTKKVLGQAGCLNATDKIACLGKLSGFELVNLPLNAKYVPPSPKKLALTPSNRPGANPLLAASSQTAPISPTTGSSSMTPPPASQQTSPSSSASTATNWASSSPTAPPTQQPSPATSTQSPPTQSARAPQTSSPPSTSPPSPPPPPSQACPPPSSTTPPPRPRSSTPPSA